MYMQKPEIRELDYNTMKGQLYSAQIHSDKFLSIEPVSGGFAVEWVDSDEELRMSITDEILSDWLENPVAYGAYMDGELVGFVRAFWKNGITALESAIFVFSTWIDATVE